MDIILDKKTFIDISLWELYISLKEKNTTYIEKICLLVMAKLGGPKNISPQLYETIYLIIRMQVWQCKSIMMKSYRYLVVNYYAVCNCGSSELVD